jgi:hypothetical protein
MGNLTYWQMVRIKKLEDELVKLYQIRMSKKAQQ